MTMNRLVTTILAASLLMAGLVACQLLQRSANKKVAKTTTMDSTTFFPAVTTKTEAFMLSLLKKYPHFFDSIIAKKDEFGVQIIYTQVDRNKNGKPIFTDHYFNVNSSNYFYPASTVKFPSAVLTLQKLNELKIAGLDKNNCCY